MCCSVSSVLHCSPESCSSLFCTTLRAGLIGTDMKRAVTYHVMHSPSPSVMLLISSVQCCVFCMWCYDLPTSG